MTKNKSIQRGPKEKYPWTTWFNGQAHQLRPYIEFTCSVTDMICQSRNKHRTLVERGILPKNTKLSCIRYTDGSFRMQLLAKS